MINLHARVLTGSGDLEVDEPKAASDDEQHADGQGELSVVGHPVPQSVEERVGRVVYSAVKARPYGAPLGASG